MSDTYAIPGPLGRHPAVTSSTLRPAHSGASPIFLCGSVVFDSGEPAAVPVPRDHGADRGQALGDDHVPGRAETGGLADLGQELGNVPFGPAGGLAHRLAGEAAQRRDAGGQGSAAGQHRTADDGQGLGLGGVWDGVERYPFGRAAIFVGAYVGPVLVRQPG